MSVPKAREALRQKQRDDDLAAVASTVAGRRFLIALLRDLNGGPFGSCSSETLQRLAVLRDKALLLEQRLMRVSPEGYRLLKAEQVGENLQEILLGE